MGNFALLFCTFHVSHILHVSYLIFHFLFFVFISQLLRLLFRMGFSFIISIGILRDSVPDDILFYYRDRYLLHLGHKVITKSRQRMIKNKDTGQGYNTYRLYRYRMVFATVSVVEPEPEGAGFFLLEPEPEYRSFGSGSGSRFWVSQSSKKIKIHIE
jgi:hypothetical protein